MTVVEAIRAETPADRRQVREVHIRAFWADPRVPDLADALRDADAPRPPLSYVATLDDRVVGHVLLSASRLDAPRRLVDVLVLSPIGVHPDHQGHGIGTRLIEHALAAADRQGAPLVFLEGDPRYYGKRGFENARAAGFGAPSVRIPDVAFQVARLSAYEPWMTGTLVYSETFWALDCVGLRYPDDVPSLPEVVATGEPRSVRAGAAAELIRRSMAARWVGVYTVAAGTVRNEGWSGPGAPAYPDFPVDQGLTAHAIRAGSVALSNDVTRDPRYLANQADSGSELIVPVLDAAGEVVGTLDVESAEPGAFGGADIAEYEGLARMLRPLWDQ